MQVTDPSDPPRVRTRVRKLLENEAPSPSVPMDVAVLHVNGEPIPASVAFEGPYQPIPIGSSWGAAWDTSWFRMSGRIPNEWAGHEVMARVGFGYIGFDGFGAEGLLYRDGHPVRGVSVGRDEFQVTTRAIGGEEVLFHVEMAANPAPPWGTQIWPLLLPDPGGEPLYRLDRAELFVADRKLASRRRDLRVLLELSEQVDDAEVAGALEEACESFEAGNDVKFPRGEGGSHRVSAIGHAHLDTAWLWPLREAIRKCARTFANALALMDEFPEFRFAASQAQHYQWMKDYYPDLFARIKERVKEGRWEPVGSMWVESDCNVPSGESLVRQVLYGKRFFERELGYETEDIWLPDVFGITGALPQIMRRAGLRYFLTQKLSWNDTNRFPHHSFWWEGIDGSRVFAHFPPADTYNATFGLDEIFYGQRNFKDGDRWLYVYGFGDGGGGPTAEMLETARRLQKMDGVPNIELERAIDFFRKAEEESNDLPIWPGELYLEFHRGTYTTQAATKKGNRQCELALRDAEMWSALSGPSHPSNELEEAWKTTLLNQFHDILPGSSIHWVYQDSARDHREVLETAESISAEALEALAEQIDCQGLERPVAFFNSTSLPRDEVVEVEGISFRAEVPACGYAVYDLTSVSQQGEVSAGDGYLENELLRVEWDAHGLLTSIWDKEVEREVLAGKGNVFQIHPDNPRNFDAWNVDIEYRDSVEDLTDLNELVVREKGPLVGSVELRRPMLTQTMRLASGSRRLEFHTTVDWQETHKFLKVAFPVGVTSRNATYEIQFGHVERPTHFETSWARARFEVWGHRWADLSEPGYGVALLNDCKYGYDIFGNVMRLSLLRAPTWPDPVADRGRHEFAYALMPHPGDFRDGRVIEEAMAFNLPLRHKRLEPSAGERPRVQSFFSVDKSGVIIDTIKKSEDSDTMIVRLYEAYGRGGPARISSTLPIRRVFRCDLLEKNDEELQWADGSVHLDLGPFELVTLKLQ